MVKRFLLVASFPASVLSFRGKLIEELQARDVDVHVAAPGLDDNCAIRDGLFRAAVTPHDIPLERTGTNPVSDLRLGVALYRLLRQIRPDIVLSYTIKPVVYGLLAARLARVPKSYALITGLGHVFVGADRGFTSRLAQFLYRIALRKVDKVFFQNPDDQALFTGRNILPSHVPSVVISGSGVDLAHFTQEPFMQGLPKFLMIARLLGDKGVREYAAAAARVRASNPKVVFSLVGWIDNSPDAISQTELDDWINHGTLDFLGRLEDVRPAIVASTVYVLPSYREGTPRSVLEAMAMGRPIITTDAPGCRETVVDGESGFLVPVKSVESLAEAMQKFIDDPDLAERMGKRAREIAMDKYDVHKVNAVMLREMGIT